jgi:hypothetical protein
MFRSHPHAHFLGHRDPVTVRRRDVVGSVGVGGSLGEYWTMDDIARSSQRQERARRGPCPERNSCFSAKA